MLPNDPNALNPNNPMRRGDTFIFQPISEILILRRPLLTQRYGYISTQ